MKKRQSGILLAAALLCTGLAGCEEQPDTLGALEAGASQFGQGKTEESYLMADSGAVLDDLLEKYAGSRQLPTGTPMDDDDLQDLIDEEKEKGDEGKEEPGQEPTPSVTETIVRCADDMMEYFHTAYDNTAETLSFPIDGYEPNGEDLQYVYTQLQRDDPYDVCCVDSWNYSWQDDRAYFTIKYNVDVNELKTMKVETRNLVKQAVASLDTAGKTPYELAYAVNEYLCDVSEYPASEPYAPVTHTAYGALKNGSSVCEGYACAAKMMLNELNVPCDIEVGECINGGGHAWNLVQLDGEWYQMDVTWNDGCGDRQEYFLVTDDFMRQSRTWSENQYPVCADKAYAP